MLQKGERMKNKNLLIAIVVAVLVLFFSALSLGAGQNTEKSYIGTWERNSTDEHPSRLVIYPCHVAEKLHWESYYNSSKGHREGYLLDTNGSVSWAVDNGYLVLDGRYCYLTRDGGNTLEGITAKDGGGGIYSRIE